MQSILVCDDDKQIVEAIDIYLTGEEFEVIKAYDGAEALELLKTHTVNLMILDVMMPGLDGIRTTLKVRETSSIPIIILSAKSEDADQDSGLKYRGGRLYHEAIQPAGTGRPREIAAPPLHAAGKYEQSDGQPRIQMRRPADQR